jgi:hypothetical protein
MSAVCVSARCNSRMTVAREVEQVVDELKRHAEADAVLLECALLFGCHIAEDSADARAPAKEIRRFAPDDVEVLVLADEHVALL